MKTTVKRMWSRWLALLLWGGLCLVPLRAMAQGKEPEPRPPLPRQIEPLVPQPSVMSGKNVVEVLSDRPREKMNKALKDLYDGHPKDTAKKIEEAAASIRSAADTSLAGTVRADLLLSIKDLESKAKQVRLGAMDGKGLMPVFARALRALAAHHTVMADAQWRAGREVEAGLGLRAAILDASQAVQWGEVSLTAEENDLLSAATEDASRLIEEKSVDKDAVTRVVAEMSKFMLTLDGRLPRPRA